jgi:hypothetical protein
MNRILFIVLAALALLAGPAHAATCYRVVEYYSPEMWGTYHLLANNDLTFVTEKGEWGVWNSDPTDTMLYFQFWHARWDYPYLFLSGSKKAGFCQSETGIIGQTGQVGYYTLKRVKLTVCNSVVGGGAASESLPPGEE